MKSYRELIGRAKQLSQCKATTAKAIDLYLTIINQLHETGNIADLSEQGVKDILESYTSMLLLLVNRWSQAQFDEYHALCDAALDRHFADPAVWHNCIFVNTVADDLERSFSITNAIYDFNEDCRYVSLYWLTTEQLFYVEGLQSADCALDYANKFLEMATDRHMGKDISVAHQWIQYYAKRLQDE